MGRRSPTGNGSLVATGRCPDDGEGLSFFENNNNNNKENKEKKWRMKGKRWEGNEGVFGR